VAESSAEAYLMKNGIKRLRPLENARDGLKSPVGAEGDGLAAR